MFKRTYQYFRNNGIAGHRLGELIGSDGTQVDNNNNAGTSVHFVTLAPCGIEVMLPLYEPLSPDQAEEYLEIAKQHEEGANQLIDSLKPDGSQLTQVEQEIILDKLIIQYNEMFYTKVLKGEEGVLPARRRSSYIFQGIDFFLRRIPELYTHIIEDTEWYNWYQQTKEWEDNLYGVQDDK